MQSEIDSLREINSKLLAEITELKKENAEVKAENVKLKHALEEHEARFTSLEQRDEEKATLIAKLDDDIKEIKQSSTSTSSVENSDICVQPIRTETKTLEEKETDAFLNEVHKKSVGNEIRKRNKEKKLQRESACEDLIKEISTSISCNTSIQNHPRGTSHDSISQVTEISLTSGQGKSDILQNIANLYEKACDAEDVSIKANQAEILCWRIFIIAFDKSIDEIMARDRVGMKKAKGLIYDFILAQNPDTKRPALYKKIERARKIYRLTETIGLDKVIYIKSYSANSISKFTNEEIQRVMDHFTKNPDMEFTDDSEDVEQDNEVPEGSDQINVLEVSPPKESTAPIPLVNVSNSSDNSKEEAWFDEDMFFNETNPTKVNTTTSDDDDVYFDEANEEVPSGPDNTHDGGSNSCNDDSDPDSNSEDEMPDNSDDDGYNGYGGYNEYGERDRGYYYRDGRYERKTSPMMSPIISPVTA